MLRTPDIKPYIIYIKPPPFDILKSTRNAAFAMSTFDETNSRGFTVSKLVGGHQLKLYFLLEFVFRMMSSMTF